MTQFSYQLYNSRNFPPWVDTMQMLSELGYTQVEGFGPLYEDIAATKAALQAAGLAMPTGHFSLQMLEQEQDRVLKVAQELGIKIVYCPYLLPEERPHDAAGYVEFGQRLQAAGEFCTKAGLGFGWHNHDFEFVGLGDGSTPMQRILEAAPDISWEADIAWLIRAGADPLEWIEKEGGRITAVHVKDIAPAGECEDEDGWIDVGLGVVDWQSIMTALKKTSVQYFILEHDNPSDPRRFAQRSINFCKTL